MLIFIMTLSGCGGGGDGGASGGGTGGDGGSSANHFKLVFKYYPDQSGYCRPTRMQTGWPEKHLSHRIILRTRPRCYVVLNRKTYIPVDDKSDSKALPESFSWTAKDGNNWMTPVRQQGLYGTCVAFSTIGVMEAMFNIQSGTPSSDTNFSEWYLWHNGNGIAPNPGGWNRPAALGFLYNSGTVAESACYYSDIPDYIAPSGWSHHI